MSVIPYPPPTLKVVCSPLGTEGPERCIFLGIQMSLGLHSMYFKREKQSVLALHLVAGGRRTKAQDSRRLAAGARPDLGPQPPPSRFSSWGLGGGEAKVQIMPLTVVPPLHGLCFCDTPHPPSQGTQPSVPGCSGTVDTPHRVRKPTFTWWALRSPLIPPPSLPLLRLLQGLRPLPGPTSL